MGRLQVEIRHGHRDGGGPAQWGAVIALVLFVLLAAAGHKEIGTLMHEVLTVAEITACILGGAAVLAAAVFIAVRARAARRARARAAVVIPPAYRVRVEPAARPVLGSPRRRAAGWPLPGDWDEITPGDDKDRRRYS